MSLQPPDGYTPEEAAILHLAWLQIYRKLPDDSQRLVVYLKHEAHMSYSDIAFAMGRSDTTIRNLLKKAQEHLRRKLR